MRFGPIILNLEVCVCVCSGTEKARAVTQTLIDVPYGEGDREKLDVYLPCSSSPGEIQL